jgi:SOS-response transcriptional repressor LexA
MPTPGGYIYFGKDVYTYDCSCSNGWMMEPKMTRQWERVMRFIRAYIRIHGVSPSYGVLAEGLGLKSRSNMHRIVTRLEEEGYLEKKPRKFYGVKVVDRSVKDVLSL